MRCAALVRQSLKPAVAPGVAVGVWDMCALHRCRRNNQHTGAGTMWHAHCVLCLVGCDASVW
jgi:hypothetical protein